MVLTGGPGTGKTTTLNGVIHLCTKAGSTVLLAAPTGRAAKRMTELTGKEAKTIHRLLGTEYNEAGEVSFTHNEQNQLQADVIIVDEVSMVDTLLFAGLLRAVRLSARIILVGDADQLPSVGAGQLLQTFIESKRIPVVRLTEIFRQAQESCIIRSAHRIVNGEMPDLLEKHSDFFFFDRRNANEAAAFLKDLYSRRLPQAYKYTPQTDIQVISPTRKGILGTVTLNQMLQDWLNDNTGHMLEESAEGVKTNPDTILALASAIYFKAAWENQFEESATKKAEIFHAGSGERRCDYLVSDESGAALFVGTHFTAYGRPMKDGNTMWFFLPEEGMRPEELSKDPEFLQFLQSDPRTDFSDRIQYCTLHAEIPKFDVNSDLDLIRTLQALGVSDVFSFTDSDFSPILTDGTNAAVSQMQHSARVRIDEEGCEAAAFTVIMLEKAMYMEQERAAFILDRPFIFAIRGASGAALFTGIVNEPGETSF